MRHPYVKLDIRMSPVETDVSALSESSSPAANPPGMELRMFMKRPFGGFREIRIAPKT